MSASGEQDRLWAGTTLAQRKQGRRARLLAAGTVLLAGGGAQAVTVRAVCRESSLTTRYFYEHFADREQFIHEVFQAVADECQAVLEQAVAASAGDPRAVARAAVDAVVGMTVDRPDAGRVLFVAPMTDAGLFAARDRNFPALTELIAEQIPRKDSAEVRRLKAASLVGALSHVFFQYVDGRLDVEREAFVRHCVDLLVAVAGI